MRWRILLDTNVVLRYTRVADPRYHEVKAMIDKLMSSGHDLFVSPQCIREAWVVLTRPEEENGFGLEPSAAAEYVDTLLGTFFLLDDEPGIFAEWRDLVASHEVRGRQAHDANLAAAVRHHGLTHVLTLNEKDFNRYALSGLQTLTPRDLP